MTDICERTNECGTRYTLQKIKNDNPGDPKCAEAFDTLNKYQCSVGGNAGTYKECHALTRMKRGI